MTDLRTLENDSIRAFVQSAADDGYLSGRVLDVGAGRQPYRDVVEAAKGEYVPYDAPSFPASVVSEDTTGEAFGRVFDTVLCLQTVQYVEDVLQFLRKLRWDRLNMSGHLVLTYPTTWPEVEPEDLHRFTKAGMTRLLTEAGFEIVRHERRASAYLHYPMNTYLDEVALGYGVICRA